MKDNEIEDKEIYEYSKKNMASYSTGQFFGQWFTNSFGMFVFFFYETEIGLNVGIAALAFILYSLWNAVNDPLSGYLMERIHMPWEKKWGKRFPWIVIFSIPWVFSFALIFMVPLNLDPIHDQWIIFGWLLLTICLFDTFFTIWNISYTAMYPDKFRGSNERRTAAAIGTLIGMAGLVAASLVPPMFLVFGVPESFRVMAWALVGIGLIAFFFMIPGIWEDEKTRARYQQRRMDAKKDENKSFVKTAKMVLTDKKFMVKVLFFFGYQAAVALLQGSAAYMIAFVLNMEASTLSILLGGMLLGAILSTPIWMHFSKTQNNNRKMSLIAGVAMFLTFLPMMFVNTFLGFLMSLILFGIGLGGQWFMDPPTMGDVLDDIAVRTGKRQEAVYYGYNAFFIRFGGAFQAITFAIVHSLTGFVEGASTRKELAALSPNLELALFGIRVHAALIPAILVLITILLFWKFYDLTPDKVKANKEKLKEMGL
ncbi:MAG: MFS transporter [Promethearchaeota archaeon]